MHPVINALRPYLPPVSFTFPFTPRPLFALLRRWQLVHEPTKTWSVVRGLDKVWMGGRSRTEMDLLEAIFIPPDMPLHHWSVVSPSSPSVPPSPLAQSPLPPYLQGATHSASSRDFEDDFVAWEHPLDLQLSMQTAQVVDPLDLDPPHTDPL